ncbi:MAG TPA: ABC transporter ATP-binding protein [Thermomicrobiales bacterium]|jgi:osmoprotectant transport system ATP-binding protein
MKAIRFDRVSKQFPGAPRPSVDECSFAVEAGQFVTLLGPSGCGKTTLLKMVNRLYEPTGGTIFIDSTDVRKLPVTELRRQIGYVIQQTGLFPHLTVAQNIAVVPTLLKWSKDKIAARVDELLALIELAPDEYRSRYPAQLSGGQQQRVGLARALAADPGVILMDEPFSAIDAITREALQDEMLRLQRKVRKTILFVTHDVEEALRLADKIVVMRTGKIVQYDTPFNILTRPADPFVAELLGADDIVRRLGLIRVAGAMAPLSPGSHIDGAPTIGADGDLREALSALLRTGAESLIVRQGDQAVGRVALEQIRDAARVRVPA